MTPGGKAVTGVTTSWQSGTDLHVWEGFKTLWCEIARTPQKVSSSWGSKSWGKRVYAFWNACFTATIRTRGFLSLKTFILSLDFTSFWDFTAVMASITTDLFLFYKNTPGYILCSLFTLLQPLSQGYTGFLICLPTSELYLQIHHFSLHGNFPYRQCVTFLSGAYVVRRTPPTLFGNTGFVVIVPMCNVEVQQGVKVLARIFLFTTPSFLESIKGVINVCVREITSLEHSLSLCLWIVLPIIACRWRSSLLILLLSDLIFQSVDGMTCIKWFLRLFFCSDSATCLQKGNFSFLLVWLGAWVAERWVTL